MRDPGTVELKAMMARLSLFKNWISDSAWQYYAKRYNQLKDDSQSIPKVMRNEERWTGRSKERGRGRESLHGYTD
jgi:hypothetical protein